MFRKNSNQLLFPIIIITASALMITIPPVTSRCPPYNLVNPCVCSESTNSLMCVKSRDQDFNSIAGGRLQQIFNNISQYYAAADANNIGGSKHFDQLMVVNTDQREFGPAMLANLTFDRVFIYEHQLSRIHSQLFARTRQTVRQVYMNVLSLMDSPTDGYSVFRALASLVNVESVHLDLDLILTAIPEHAFRTSSVSEKQTKLREIAISGMIDQIGDYAFEDIPNLRKLQLRANELNELSPHCLAFKPSVMDGSGVPEELELDLSYNKLSAETIAPGSLSNTNRRLDINLDNNKVHYLDESVFGSLVTGNRLTRLSLADNGLNCSDCRSHWLLGYRSTHESRIVGAHCLDSPAHTIWTYQWSPCAGLTTKDSTTTSRPVSTGNSLAISQQQVMITFVAIIIINWCF